MLTMTGHAGRPESSSLPSDSGPSKPVSYEISLKKFKDLPEDFSDDLQRRLIPREELVADILELRRPEARSLEAGKQLVRFQLLEKHLPQMKDEEKNALLQKSVEKNHPSLFQFLIKKPPSPDTVGLLCAAARSENEEAFQEFLGRLENPMPPEKLDKTLERVADCGVPDKLERVLESQPNHGLPSERLAALRFRAKMQQPSVRQFFDPQEGVSVFQAIMDRHTQILSRMLNL